jgi:hypothetical protein
MNLVGNCVGGGGVRSVQTVSDFIANGQAIKDVTISSVDTDNTIVFGKIRTSSGNQTPDDNFYRFSLTGATNIRLFRGGTTGDSDTCTLFVVEFSPGIINSIQRKVITITGVSGTQAISSVDTSKSIIVDGGHTSATTSSGGDSYNPVDYSFNSSTEVLLERTAAANSDNQIFAYQVIEFK